jgi:hypothetical protein
MPDEEPVMTTLLPVSDAKGMGTGIQKEMKASFRMAE